MGYYINPPTESKESFLQRKGKLLTNKPLSLPENKEEALVCLINNGFFTAAGICYSEKEREEFGRNDGRPKSWYIVPKSELYLVSDIQESSWR